MRLILFITLFSTYLFAIITSPVHTTVNTINEVEQEITITTLPQAQIGMYGAIVHWFDAEHSIALSWVEVTHIEGTTTTLKMSPIYALEQSALPSGKWTPHVGDEVILGYNYHRALLIAPNPSVYKKVTAYHPERKWVHPDIFATTLSTNGHPSPLTEDFSQACRANNIGLVAFSFEKSLLTVDCHSFKIMENKSTTIESDETQLPFYTRLNTIEANWFGDGSDELTDYTSYYVSLLAQNNPDNAWIQEYAQNSFEQEEGSSSWFDFWSSDDEEVEAFEETSEEPRLIENDDEFIPDE